MSENTKILSVIAVILAVIILFWEVRERRVQAQQVDTDIRIQDKMDVTGPQGKTEIKEEIDDKIEIKPDQAPPQQQQRRILRQRQPVAPKYPQQQYQYQYPQQQYQQYQYPQQQYQPQGCQPQFRGQPQYGPGPGCGPGCGPGGCQ